MVPRAFFFSRVSFVNSNKLLKIKQKCGFSGVALVLIFLAANPAFTDTSAGEAGVQSHRGMVLGDSLEPRTLETVTREEVRIPAEEGLTVVLFWATWSPRSRSALQLWQKYEKEYRDHPLTVITVNADNQRMESGDIQRVDQFIRDNEIGLPVVIDFKLAMFNEIGVVVNPTSLFFKEDGELVYKLPSFPTSAPVDLKMELDLRFGLKKQETEEEKAARGKLDYQPKNNALLYYNMAINLWKKGFPDKARDRLVISLQRDPDYADPLRALEGLFFSGGRTTGAEAELKMLLVEKDLEPLVEKVGQGEPLVIGGDRVRSDPMERMRQLMGVSDQPGTSVPQENIRVPTEENPDEKTAQ